MPAVLTMAENPAAARTATAVTENRVRFGRFPAAQLAPPKAASRTGNARTGNAPMAPPMIDGSSTGRIATQTPTSSAIAPSRSRHGARLNPSNPTTTPTAPANAAISPTTAASGTMT